MLYFAYGSNMSHKQMKERCLGSIFISCAKINDYKLVFDGLSQKRKCAVANIIFLPHSFVWGGLFEINEKHLDSLDRNEGYNKSPKSYNSKGKYRKSY